MKFEQAVLELPTIYVDLEAPGDQVVISAPSRPHIIEYAPGEWRVFLTDAAGDRKWPERRLYGGPGTKDDQR